MATDTQLRTFLRWLRNRAYDLPQSRERDVYETCADMLQGLMTDPTCASPVESDAKDAIPHQHAWAPDATGTACAACGGTPLEHDEGGEVVVACDCGNRDTITLPLTAMPPCSGGCGRRMRIVGIYHKDAISLVSEEATAKPINLMEALRKGLENALAKEDGR